MGMILKGIGIIIGLFIFLAVLGAMFGSDDTSRSDANTKTAYTQDGKNFVSKERVDENIEYGYAKDGDYKEVQVPLNTVIVGASVVPSSKQEEKTTQTQTQSSASTPKQTTTKSTSDDIYVHVQHSGQQMNKIGYSTPDPGKVYLVVNLNLENHGYSGVDTNPNNFKIEANSIEYGYSPATYSLPDAGYPKLDTVTLKDGGKISGRLAFEVPKGTTSYTLTFDSWFKDVRYN
jgi:hypothetical protein